MRILSADAAELGGAAVEGAVGLERLHRGVEGALRGDEVDRRLERARVAELHLPRAHARIGEVGSAAAAERHERWAGAVDRAGEAEAPELRDRLVADAYHAGRVD